MKSSIFLCGENFFMENGPDDFHDSPAHVEVIGHGLGHGDFAGPPGGDALDHELTGVNQQAGRNPFFQPWLLEMADLFGQLGQRSSRLEVDPLSWATILVSSSAVG